MQYYPDQRIVSKLSTIHRECLLPEEAIGVVRAQEGAKVEVRDVVANGRMLARHRFIDAAKILGLRDKKAVEGLLLVKLNQIVEADTAIAGKRKDRGNGSLHQYRGRLLE